MRLEDILEGIIEKYDVFAVWSMGAQHKTSDKDVTILFYDASEAKKAAKDIQKYIDVLKQYKATLYFGTVEDYHNFNVRSYYVGQDGIGDDYGWGTLASSIRLSYMVSTMKKIYAKDENEFQEFLNSMVEKLNTHIIPINEPYELYVTAKWGSFFEYLITGNEPKLAKATLRLFYSLLAMDDGRFRNDYETIVKEAPLLNMGYIIYYLDESGNLDESLFENVLLVKKGERKFTENEKLALDNLFLITGSFLEQYAIYSNLFGEPTINNRIKDYIKKKIQVYGGLDEVIKVLSEKIDNKEYSKVLIYVGDLIPLLDNEKHKEFIKKMVNVYEDIMRLKEKIGEHVNTIGKKKLTIYHLSNYFKLKYMLNELNVDELDYAIKEINTIKKKGFSDVYVARGVNRSNIFIDMVLSDLFYYRVLLDGDEDKEKLKKMMKFSLIYDPFNEDKIKLAMKLYGARYEFRNLSSLIHDKSSEFAQVYRNILIEGLKYRKDKEILALINLKEKREEGVKEYLDEWGILKFDIYFIKNNNRLLNNLIENVKNNLEITYERFKEALIRTYESKVLNADEVIKKIYLNFSDTIYKSEIEIMLLLGYEHVCLLEGLRNES